MSAPHGTPDPLHAEDQVPDPVHHADEHSAGHDGHHDVDTIGPIAWRMWGVGVLGVVVALVVVAAFVVATGFVFLDLVA